MARYSLVMLKLPLNINQRIIIMATKDEKFRLRSM